MADPTTDTTSITSYEQGQINNPTLPDAATLTPVLQSVQGNELMTGANSTLSTNAQSVPDATQVNAPTVNQTQAAASQVDQNNVPGATAAQYTAATTGGQAAQGQASTLTVNPMDTVSGQLTNLYSQSAAGKIPTWAQGAVAQANDALASRGLGASTIGAAAIAATVQASALNIATSDASTYFQADMANFSAQTQFGLQNLQNRQQSLLSDQAAENAALQFNATSSNQTQQFMSSLVASIQAQNADRMTAISQFNAGQANTISATNASNAIQTGEFNQTQQAAIDQFNATLLSQRQTFNAQNAFAVEQSNVTWRRTVNTANTAAVNAANQVNTQNTFNLSSTALNNVWQQFRDESSWIFTASQNQNTINANAALQANNQTFVTNQNPNQFLTTIGNFAASLLLNK